MTDERAERIAEFIAPLRVTLDAGGKDGTIRPEPGSDGRPKKSRSKKAREKKTREKKAEKRKRALA